MMDLIEGLEEFDGKRTAVLERIDAGLERDERSLARLLDASRDGREDFQTGATWLLKRWHDEDERVIEDAAPSLVAVLEVVTSWGAQLHLLQILADLEVPEDACAALTRLLPGCLESENKFVRAWSLSVLASLGDQHVELRDGVLDVLDGADGDEAASVRARLRQLRKRFKWMRTGGAS